MAAARYLYYFNHFVVLNRAIEASLPMNYVKDSSLRAVSATAVSSQHCFSFDRSYSPWSVDPFAC